VGIARLLLEEVVDVVGADVGAPRLLPLLRALGRLPHRRGRSPSRARAVEVRREGKPPEGRSGKEEAGEGEERLGEGFWWEARVSGASMGHWQVGSQKCLFQSRITVLGLLLVYP